MKLIVANTQINTANRNILYAIEYNKYNQQDNKMKNLDAEVQQTISEMKKAFGIGVNKTHEPEQIFTTGFKSVRKIVDTDEDIQERIRLNEREIYPSESYMSEEHRQMMHWIKSNTVDKAINNDIREAKSNGVENFGELEML